MQTIQINNAEIENFIKLQYGQDNDSLLNDFMVFIKTELISHEMKKGFDEVKLFESGQKPLNNIEDVISRLRSEY